MRINFSIVCLLFSVQSFATPQILHWQTTNEVNVYFVEIHELPMIDIQLVFDAGSARDPEGKKGLAVLTNSLLVEGAGGLNADAISYEFERLGAILNLDAGLDSASVTLRSLSDREKLDPALANLNRIIARPDFPGQAIQRQRKRLLVSIQHKQQSPAAIADDAFQSAVYGSHPYAFPAEGLEKTVKTLNAADIGGFYKKYYTANNSILVLVGDIDEPGAKQLAEELMQVLPKGQTPPAMPAVQSLARAEQVKIEHPSTQMHILLGQPGVKRVDPDYFPLYVGNHVLGGGGLVSRLFKEIREKRGLSYGASSYFSPRREAGPFVAGIQTRADQAEAALLVLRDAIKAFIEHGPTREELDAAKKNITGGFPIRLDSNSKILAYVAMIGFYGLPLNYLDTFNDTVNAVTAEQVTEAFARRLDPDKMVTVTVGPLPAGS